MKLNLTRAARAAITASALAATAPAYAHIGGVGWQAPALFNVATGTPQLFVHYDCPAGFSVQNGAFLVVGTQATFGNGFAVTGNGPRMDINPAYYGQWAWEFQWPAGGAPAGSQLTLNVYCKKGAP
jgi:hypothetical protein